MRSSRAVRALGHNAPHNSKSIFRLYLMMLCRSLLLHPLTTQKVLFVFLFVAVVRSFRIHAIHVNTLLLRKLRQVSNKQNELPSIVFLSVSAAKRWHPREPDSVLDDPEKFAVGKILRFRLSQIRWLRVQTLAVHRVATSVIAVT